MRGISQEDMEAFQDLCQTAEEGIHREFEYLGCMEELFRAREVKKSLRQVVRMFKRFARSCETVYLDLLKKGEDDVALMTSMTCCMRYVKFYEEELGIVKDMIDEYHYYFLTPAKLIDNVLLGIYRPEEDHHDFRYKETKVFEDQK